MPINCADSLLAVKFILAEKAGFANKNVKEDGGALYFLL